MAGLGWLHVGQFETLTVPMRSPSTLKIYIYTYPGTYLGTYLYQCLALSPNTYISTDTVVWTCIPTQVCNLFVFQPSWSSPKAWAQRESVCVCVWLCVSEKTKIDRPRGSSPARPTDSTGGRPNSKRVAYLTGSNYGWDLPVHITTQQFSFQSGT